MKPPCSPLTKLVILSSRHRHTVIGRPNVTQGRVRMKSQLRRLRFSLCYPDYGFDSKSVIRLVVGALRFFMRRALVRGAYKDWSRDAHPWPLCSAVRQEGAAAAHLKSKSQPTVGWFPMTSSRVPFLHTPVVWHIWERGHTNVISPVSKRSLYNSTAVRGWWVCAIHTRRIKRDYGAVSIFTCEIWTAEMKTDIFTQRWS